MLDNASLCQNHQNIVKLNFPIIVCTMRLPFMTLIINVKLLLVLRLSVYKLINKINKFEFLIILYNNV